MPNYQLEYQEKLKTPKDAVSSIVSGQTIVYGIGSAQPPALLKAISNRVREDGVTDLEMFSFLSTEVAYKSVISPDLCTDIQSSSWFVSRSDRGLVKFGLNYFIPSYLHQIPRLCTEFMKVDVALAMVSPMDSSGFFSLGIGNDYISTAARSAKILLLEVNKHMPRVFGDSCIHISEVDAVLENHLLLPEIAYGKVKPEDDVVGKLIADLIPNGATLQLGIGNLPNAVGRALVNHKDIGIHTELMTPTMIDLIKCGVINGQKKNLHPRKHIFTTASGTHSMYEFMDNNPSFESYPASYVCSPKVISLNDKMVAVNAVLEFDLLGQCNAEFLDGSQWSGTGGQLDFVRGAFDSKGGIGILTCHSSAKGATVSRIVPRFKEGTPVTVPRADVQFLATEYGVVDVKGKSTKDRALGIISLAHPNFRDQLMAEAEQMALF
ncbi:MAG: 4-hydroxybutyrate--acetyl-CoA CoA transferase [Candidatus Riflebacteria bacterium]|nr:4-hydroxybutyrate--acetyl-CoA CoA transferase [Candidatus Riflebacteria bacterium]